MKKSLKEVNFRVSALAERQEFYEKEFSIAKVKYWFRKNKIPLQQLCAIDAGSDTGIIYDKKNMNKMLYFKFSELKNKIKKYVPEDVYYDRNYYINPDKILNSLKFNQHAFDAHFAQELVFDIDVDNIGKKVSGSNLKSAYKIAIKLKKELNKKFNFKKMKIVYSGRGFHIHVLDKKAYSFTIKERDFLNKQISKYPIDPWVSRGFIRLIRMPYTLNSLVSRVVTPINDASSFIEKYTLPKFLK